MKSAKSGPDRAVVALGFTAAALAAPTDAMDIAADDIFGARGEDDLGLVETPESGDEQP